MSYEEEFNELAASRSYPPELVISAIGLDKNALSEIHASVPLDHLAWVKQTNDNHGADRINKLIEQTPPAHIRSALSILSNLRIGKIEQALKIARDNNSYKYTTFIKSALDDHPSEKVTRALKIVNQHKLFPGHLSAICTELTPQSEHIFEQARKLTRKADDIFPIAITIHKIGVEKTSELIKLKVPPANLLALSEVAVKSHSNILTALNLGVKPAELASIADVLKTNVESIEQASEFNSPHLAELTKVIFKFNRTQAKKILDDVPVEYHASILAAAYETNPSSALTAYNLLKSKELSLDELGQVSNAVSNSGANITKSALEICNTKDIAKVAAAIKHHGDNPKTRSAVAISNKLKLDFADIELVINALHKMPANELEQYLKRLPREQRSHGLIAFSTEPNIVKLRARISNKFTKFKLNYKPVKANEFECRVRMNPFAYLQHKDNMLVVYPSEADRTKLALETPRWGVKVPGAIGFVKFNIINGAIVVSEINSELFSSSGPKLSYMFSKKYASWTDMIVTSLKKYATSKRIKQIKIPTTVHQLRSELVLHPKKAFEMYSQAPYNTGFKLVNTPITINDVTTHNAWQWTNTRTN